VFALATRDCFRPPFSKGGAGVGGGSPHLAVSFLPSFFFAAILPKKKALQKQTIF
jgi:hypothetical protein